VWLARSQGSRGRDAQDGARRRRRRTTLIHLELCEPFHDGGMLRHSVSVAAPAYVAAIGCAAVLPGNAPVLLRTALCANES